MPLEPDPSRARGDSRAGNGLVRRRGSGLEPATQGLLDAFAAIASNKDTRAVLSHLVVSACDLAGTCCGALAVLGPDGAFLDVVGHGLDERALLATGALPADRGAQFPVRVRGTEFGVLFLADRADGGDLDEQDLRLVGGLTAVAGFVIANAQAYALSERRRRWLEMFSDLTELLQPPITLEDALERIAESVREASGAESASVVQVPESGDPIVAAVAGEPYALTSKEKAAFNKALHTVVTSGEVKDLPIGDRVAVLAALRAHLTIPGVVITVHARRAVAEHAEERDLLASFAGHAALALDRTQALEDREHMAVVTDRDRIARDLHDVVIQRLFATGLHMQSIRSAATTPELTERIDQSVRDLDQTIRDIRGTIFELQTRPQNSLRTEIRELVREYVPVLGFAPSVQTHGPVDSSVEPNLQQQLAAVLREALSNVAKHSGASEVSVELRVTPTHLRLRVSDNGTGMPQDRHESGLRNARRRAVLLGGNLDLWPNEPTGTSFLWSVPYQPGAGASRVRG